MIWMLRLFSALSDKYPRSTRLSSLMLTVKKLISGSRVLRGMLNVNGW